jgi:DNA-binding NarL/FixJ family response regulator
MDSDHAIDVEPATTPHSSACPPFEHWLAGSSVLLVEGDKDEAARYQAWLGDVGATVTSVRQLAQVEEALGGSSREFCAAVVSVTCAGGPEMEMAELVRAHQAGCILLVQSAEPSCELLNAVRRLGAAFLSKSASQLDFTCTLIGLLDFQVPEPRMLVARAQKQWPLSRQLTRVLYYNLWSCSNEEIAQALGVTLHTVQDYQQDLRRKTGARSKDGYLRRLLECSGREAPPACYAPKRLRDP